MITLEQTTNNVIFTKGMFAINISAFQFNWQILNRIFVSTFRKYERFCPLLKTLQTSGGNPIKMPDDCIYPRAIGFGSASMITPQVTSLKRSDWSYDRQTQLLSIFTNTGSLSNLKVQYLARYPQIKVESTTEPYEVFEGEQVIQFRLNELPNPSTLKIAKNGVEMKITSRDKECWTFEADFGTGALDLTSLELVIEQTDTSAGTYTVDYTAQYEAFDCIIEDLDFFETWYASNILSSLGNIKAIIKMDAMPNDINADNLLSQGRELYEKVLEFQSSKQFWWRGYISAKV